MREIRQRQSIILNRSTSSCVVSERTSITPPTTAMMTQMMMMMTNNKKTFHLIPNLLLVVSLLFLQVTSLAAFSLPLTSRTLQLGCGEAPSAIPHYQHPQRRQQPSQKRETRSATVVHCHQHHRLGSHWYPLRMAKGNDANASNDDDDDGMDDESSSKKTLIVGVDDKKVKEDKKRKKENDDSPSSFYPPAEYEARRLLWQERYGSVDALRRHFGVAQRPWWGDLSAEATRELYHTLLPRSLLGLHEAGLMNPEELAPLAYQARKAAKQYARERCTLPGRLLAKCFDGYRSFKKHGTFNTNGMSWEQVWNKYEAQIVQEECTQELNGDSSCRIDEGALVNRIYLRILERSCVTNAAFDKLFLHPQHHPKNDEKENVVDRYNPSKKDKGSTDKSENWMVDPPDDLVVLADQLERDVRTILLPPRENKGFWKWARKNSRQKQKADEEALDEKVKLEQKELKQAAQTERKRVKIQAEAIHDYQRARRKIIMERQRHMEKELKRRQQQQQQHQKKQPQLQQQQQAQALESETIEASSRTTSALPVDSMAHDLKRKRRNYPALRIMARTRRLLRNE